MYTLYNKDSLELMRLMDSESVDMIITDPPYSSGGLNNYQKQLPPSKKYQQTGTKKSYPDFLGDNKDQLSHIYWCALWLGQCFRILKSGSVICVFTDWRQLSATVNAVQMGGFLFRGIVTWNKGLQCRPLMGGFRNQCEYVVWGTKGKFNRQTSNCLPNFFTHPINHKEKLHVTAKPIGLIDDLLKIVGEPSKVIFDPFTGGGSVGVSAIQSGHKFIGCEISKEYFNIAKNSLENTKQSIADKKEDTLINAA